jgi:hypothetical protein
MRVPLKPRIRKSPYNPAIWYCTSHEAVPWKRKTIQVSGYGKTPAQAYLSWTEAMKDWRDRK